MGLASVVRANPYRLQSVDIMGSSWVGRGHHWAKLTHALANHHQSQRPLTATLSYI